MSYSEVMRLPIRAFWLMNGSINRILAEKDLRSMSVAVSTQSDEGFRKAQSDLVLELGEVVVGPASSPMDAKRDEDAGIKLRALAML